MGLDQQPVGALGPFAVLVEANQMPGALHAAAIEHCGEVPLLQLRLDAHRAVGAPIASVPQHHCAAAILALGDGALEVTVVEGMVLDFDRQAPFVGVERRPARHRPGLEHALVFEPQVVVQACGRVLLDHEAETLGGSDVLLAGRLSGDAEVALVLVGLEFAIGHRRLHQHNTPVAAEVPVRPAGGAPGTAPTVPRPG